MKIKYKPKDKGYVIVLRSIQNLLNVKGVNLSTIGAYIMFSFQADWDKTHRFYRAILLDDLELSLLWGCDKSTVYRNRKSLIDLGYFEELDGNTYVKNLDLFKIGTVQTIVKYKIANSHLYYAKTEEDLAKVMMGIAKTQNDEADLL